MRWAVLLLMLANLAAAGYLRFIDRDAAAPTDVRALEMNADKIKVLSAATTQIRTACLEWSNLTEADLPRVQAELARLRPGGRVSVRERAIVIADPSPALVARLAELKGAYPGSELKAVACLEYAS